MGKGVKRTVTLTQSTRKAPTGYLSCAGVPLLAEIGTAFGPHAETTAQTILRGHKGFARRDAQCSALPCSIQVRELTIHCALRTLVTGSSEPVTARRRWASGHGLRPSFAPGALGVLFQTTPLWSPPKKPYR